MGKYDQVIRTRQAESFLKRINQVDALIEIECGHDFFKESNLFRLKEAIHIKKGTRGCLLTYNQIILYY
jgi:hypothetical protein